MIDPANSSNLYMATYGAGVFRSTDGGASWSAANNGLGSSIVLGLALDSAGGVLYAGTGGFGVYKSTNAGVSWSAVNTGLPNPASVSCLAMDPAHPLTLYVGLYGDGVFKTTSGGARWSPAKTGLSTFDVHALAVNPVTTSVLYAATWGGGVRKSTNGGGNWIAVNTGLSNPYIEALAIDPISPNTVYAALNTGGVAKTTNGGAGWLPANAGLPPYSITALALAPSDPRTLYAGTTLDGVYRSSDGGASWSVYNAGIENRWIITLAVDPRAPGRVHAGGVDSGAFEIGPVPLAFYTVTPCRVIDTRGAAGALGGPALNANTDRLFTLAGNCGIPANAAAVSANLAVTEPSGSGHLILWAADVARPLASSINYSRNQTRGNNAILSLGAAGDLFVRCEQGAGTAHFILDVNGYFAATPVASPVGLTSRGAPASALAGPRVLVFSSRHKRTAADRN